MKQLVKVLKQADVRGKKQFLIECQGFVESPLDTAKIYELDIKEYKGKRTLQQNAYLWELISEIDKALNDGRPNDPVEIYTQCLEMANAKFEFMLVPEQALSALRNKFRAVKVVGRKRIEGVPYVNVQVFWGSSQMNTKEMSDLIDKVLDYANEVGIVTDYWQEVLK